MMATVAFKSLLILLIACYVLGEGIDDDNTSSDHVDTDILIIGAGTGGLQAAHILLEQNITNFKILEGSNRAGGSFEHVNFDGLILPTGNNWIYNDPANNETIMTMQRLDTSAYEGDYFDYKVRNDQGEDVTDITDDIYVELYDTIEKTQAIVDSIDRGERGDLPLRTWLAIGGWVAGTPYEDIVEWYDFDFLEGLHGKYMSTAGYTLGTYAEDGLDEYWVTSPDLGFVSQELGRLVEEKTLEFNKIVKHIDQSSGDRVVVTLADGEQYTANYALVTFSEGVIQQGEVTFTPLLPEWKTEQIFRYQRGIIEFIYLKFASTFWGDEEWSLHANTDRTRQDIDRHYYPAFMNCEVEGLWPGSRLLVAVVTGQEALRVESLTDEEIAGEVLGVLRSMYGEENVSGLEKIYFRRWGSDPLYYGTHTTCPASGDLHRDVKDRLDANVGRVYFAQPSSSSADKIGTIQGNREAADKAMEKMLRCIEVGECPEYEPPEEEEEGEECVPKPREGKLRKQFQNV